MDVQMSSGARDCAPYEMRALSKSDGRRGAFQKICKDACRVAGAAQETCSSEMLGGQGADFLRVVAFWSITFWSITSLGLLRRFCVIGAALRMTWHHFFVAGATL